MIVLTEQVNNRQENGQSGGLFHWDYYFEILEQVIRLRIKEQSQGGFQVITLATLQNVNGPLARYVREHRLGPAEHYVLLLALVPHIRPDFFDKVIQDALPTPGDFPCIGGMRGKQFRGFLPTGETVLFILTGEDWLAGQEIFHQIFGQDHFFAKSKAVWLEAPPDGEPLISGRLMLQPSLISYFTTGKESLPHYSAQFPARPLHSDLNWEDLVLPSTTRQQLDELRAWLNHHHEFMQGMGMSKKLAPGYRALFYGPPGTGKTVSATLLGKEFNKTVFRIDLSALVSKYIGETEKNLARLFDEAEHRDWILFFDEADAIFGKRTQVKDAHDRYANQEVSYLMQRIETFDGMVILASNLKGNLDEAFTRRFQSVLHFPYPTPEEQWLIWQKAFPDALQPDQPSTLQALSSRYRLTGANIMNIVQYCCLSAMADHQKQISTELLLLGIQRELVKEGRNG